MTNYSTTLGVTAAEVTALSTNGTASNSAIDNVVAKANEYESAQANRKSTLKDFITVLRPIVRRMKSAAAYTPMISTYDKGQAPQKGGWLTADYSKGHYTYFAYAFHRQLPYGVPGAYRLLANLLSLGKPPA